jgi:hypothetical protein
VRYLRRISAGLLLALLIGHVGLARPGEGSSSSATAGPHFPPDPSFIGTLRRGANGEVEVVDPAKAQATGARLCDPGAICVGAGRGYPTLAEALAVAQRGATIDIIGGTYRETATLSIENLTIRGVEGQPHFDCKGLRVAGDKGCLVISAPGITLENIEISGAEIAPDRGANGACIRADPGTSFTLRRILCHDSQEGILSAAGTAVIENSQFYDNGWTTQTNNLYATVGCASMIVRGSIFRDARVGDEFESRCGKTEISDSTFRSTHGSRDLDLPDGGDTLVYRSTLEKTAGAQNNEIIGFTTESCRFPADMVLKDVRILNSRSDGTIHNFAKCDGHPIVLDGVTVEGAPVREIGYILKR